MSYSQHYEEVLYPMEGAGVASLKDAAATLLGTYSIPGHYFTNSPNSKVRIKFHGMRAIAAGGAQTTAGTAGLYVDGVLYSSSKVLSSLASHQTGDNVSQDLNTISSDQTQTDNSFTDPPSWCEVTVDQLVQHKIVTQGVGAGDQTHQTYIVIQRFD